MDELDGAEKQRAMKLYLEQCLCSLYRNLTYNENPRLHTALEFQDTTSFDLLLLARHLLVDGEATYLTRVTELEAIWDTIPGAKGSRYPFSFSQKEREEIEAENEGATLGMDVMRSIQDCIDDLFPEKGLVRLDQYEESLDALAQMKEQVIDQFSRSEEERETWEKLWPFGT